MTLSLAFVPLTFVPEHDGVLVGRPDSDAYVVLPPDAAALLQRLQQGEAPEQAAHWYEATYSEPVDLDDFLHTLAGLGFLEESPTSTVEVTRRQQRLGALVLSRASLAGLVVLVLVWLAAVSAHPALLPHPRQIFFVHSILLAQVVLVLGQLPLLGLHEFCHVLAGWRAGLPSRLGVSSRMFFLVFETRLNGVLGLPRRQRYLPFLVGMLFDLGFVAACGLLAALVRHPDGTLPFVGRLALALAFPVVMRTSWQGLLFLRTDVYYVIASLLGCHDLDGAARVVATNVWRRLTGHPELDVSDWSERDRAIARWYAPLAAAGVVLLSASTATVFWRLLHEAWLLCRHGLALGVHDVHFWDVALSLGVCAAQLVVLGVVRIRALRRSSRQAVPSREALP